MGAVLAAVCAAGTLFLAYTEPADGYYGMRLCGGLPAEKSSRCEAAGVVDAMPLCDLGRDCPMLGHSL